MAKKSQLTLLTEAVEKLLNNPVAPIAPVLPIAPVAPIAPIIQNTGDHDLLTSFRSESLVEFRTIKEAINEIKTGTSKQIDDHETRINSLETSKTKQNTMMSIGIGILTLLISLVVYHLIGN